MKISNCCGCPADDNYEIDVCHCCNKPCDYIQEDDSNTELRSDPVEVVEEHPELNVSEG